MKPVLILGKGFIGTELSNFFKSCNLDHEIYSRSMLDYCDKETFDNFLKESKNKYYCVINTSGYTGRPNVDGCEKNKEDCWKYNVMFPLNVIKAANNNKLAVLHVSSGCIYNGYEKEFTEEDTPNFGLYSDISSFYSKCKHAGEIMFDGYCVYILRIRIPFLEKDCPKNYFTKLVNYDNLIDMPNSVTSVRDFNSFIFRFLFMLRDLPGGIYNCVNPGAVKASEVISIMKENGIENKNWNFIDLKQLNTVANRSNCVLSTKKIETYNIPLPNALESIERDIKIFKNYL